MYRTTTSQRTSHRAVTESEPDSSDSEQNPGSSSVEQRLGPWNLPPYLIPIFQCEPGPSGLQSNPGPSRVPSNPGPSGIQNNPGPSSLQNNPGPSGLQSNPGPSGMQSRPGPSGMQSRPGSSRVRSNPGPSGMQAIPGSSGVQPKPCPSQSRVQCDRSLFSRQELRERLNPCPPVCIDQLPKPPVLDPVAELLHYAVNVHHQRGVYDDETDYTALGQVTGRLFETCFNRMYIPRTVAHIPIPPRFANNPHLYHDDEMDRNSEMSFGESDEEFPFDDDLGIAEIRHPAHVDSEVAPNSIGTRNEVRRPPPEPPIESLNTFQQAMRRKRKKRFGRALFQNTTTIVDTMRRFIPHICRTISVLLQNLETLTEQEQRPSTRLGHDMHAEAEDLAQYYPVPTAEYRYAHCTTILHQKLYDESRHPNKPIPQPNQRELFVFTHVVNAMASVLPLLFQEVFSGASNSDIECKIKEMLEGYFREIYTSERLDAWEPPAGLRHDPEELRNLYGRVFRGTTAGVCVSSNYTDISHLLTLGLDEILQYIHSIDEKFTKKD